jgi:hypothetical protein
MAGFTFTRTCRHCERERRNLGLYAVPSNQIATSLRFSQ